MEINEAGKSARLNLMAFLSDKPMWAFWLVYSALSGILFGVFYTAVYLMAQQWWIPIVVILAVGIIWGSFAFTRDIHEFQGKQAKI